jgi:hypothetical protein
MPNGTLSDSMASLRRTIYIHLLPVLSQVVLEVNTFDPANEAVLRERFGEETISIDSTEAGENVRRSP